MAKVRKHRDGLEDHGDDYRIERQNSAQEDGTYLWVVFERKSTGLKLKSEFAHVPPEEVAIGAFAHRSEHLSRHGKHPVVKDDKGQPAETVFTHVWVPVFAGPEEEARAQLKMLVK